MILMRVDVINADVPFLIGLDALDQYGLYVDTVRDLLVCPSTGWHAPVTRKLGHVYIEWEPQHRLLFTKSELTRLHRSFHHPSNEKLVNLLRRARPKQFSQDTRRILEEISQACDTCQRFGPKPIRFKVSFPPEDDLVFGSELSIDLMYIVGNALLHIVDTATHFSAATFLKTYGQSTEGIWNAFIDIWCSTYTGYPDTIRSDSGSVFTSRRWKELTKMTGMNIQISGVEAHNSLGLGERLHSPLRRIFYKVQAEYTKLRRDLILRITIKAMNDTQGENGLVPSLLVFGVMPRFPIMNTDLPTQKIRMAALAAAQMEMNTIIAERRILTALSHNVPSASDERFLPGDEILIHREKPDRWTGPYTVKSVNHKLITIMNPNTNKPQTFNKQQVKRYIREPQIKNNFTTHDVLLDMFLPFRSTGAPIHAYHDVNLSETISPSDPRAKLFDKAKEKEINGLIEKGTWKIVSRDDVPEAANILGGRFVLQIKNKGTEKEVLKARYVVQGYRDKMKTSLVHDSPLTRPHTTRILISLAAIFGFTVFSTDVTQAYIQSAHALDRDVYIQPTGEFNLKPNQLLKLLRPLYGLSDSGDYWTKTITDHLRHDLAMQTTVNDRSFFFKRDNEKLRGMCALYVDDALQAGDESFVEETKVTSNRFQCRQREFDQIKFTGVEIENVEDGYFIHQKGYFKQIEKLKPTDSYAQHRSLRAKLAWFTMTRPDVACAIAKSAQVTADMFDKDPKTYIQQINTVINHCQKYPARVLKYPQLNKSALRLQTYTDASFGGNYDGSSQLGYIIFLADDNNRCQPLIWSSHKSKRASRSVLGSETMAFADGFDASYAIKYDIELLVGNPIPLVMLTDSLSLFDVITKASQTTEKRLMIDLKCVNEAYQKQEITQVGFVRSENNLADCLTKIRSSRILESAIDTTYLNHPIEQWVSRKPNT